MSLSISSRKNVSLWTAVLFLITGISGIILLFTHAGHGSGHHTSSFVLKHIHEIAAVPFTIFAIVHVCFNWKVLVRYLRK
ncbi:MAG TPA: DUF4405 domain-containing protein [Spirochaetota bacterium]|nr:DUF4405 domain-containing protein [Spirochaetota bacterium]